MTKSSNVLIPIISVILGIVFIAYGAVKIAGGQFIYDDFILDTRTVEGPTLVWTFYGYSPVYGRLIGLAELVAGILVLLPKTRVLGALLITPIAANITVMDFLFGFPAVKYMALLYTIMAALLLYYERERLRLLMRLLLVPSESIPAYRAAVTGVQVEVVAPEQKQPRMHPALRWGVLLVGAALLVFFANLVTFAASEGPEPTAIAYAQAHGYPDESLSVARWTTDSWAGLDARGHVELLTRDSTRIKVAVSRLHGFTTWRASSVEVVAEE